ncbi:MAG: carbohydrate deacetylase [Anaerolineae bacterium]
MPAVIVNADDLGRTAGINRGILEAHKKGIVTSSTVMVNYPAAADAFELMGAEAPFLGLGLHLNLTSGVPVSGAGAVPTLVDDAGRFRAPEGWGAVVAAFAADEVERELRAQFEQFVRMAGKLPTHLDSHHHAVYACPAGLRTMLALAKEHSLPIRRPPFADRAMDTANLWLLEGLPPARARAVAEELHGIMADHPEVRMPDRFVTSFYDEKAILGELLVILTTLPKDGVTEIMCHPGYVDGLESSYKVQREHEIRWLTHPAVHEVLVAEQIQLITFADMNG